MSSHPKAEILTIGNEVLKGSVLNTNARFLGRELSGLGFEVVRQFSCRDQIKEIKDSLKLGFSNADLLVISGGLGPTPDDLTRDAVADFFKVPLKFSQKQYDFILGYYRQRKHPVPAIVRREAMFPSNAVPLFNRFGIALGFYVRKGKKMAVVLPGVPFELENMFHTLVVPVLFKNFRLRKSGKLIVKTVGISEPGIMERLGRDFFDDVFEFGIYPSAAEAALRIFSDSPVVLKRLKSKVQNRLGDFVYAWNESTLPQVVGEKLKKCSKSVAAAESCTGGLLSAMVTQVPGASAYFKGSVTVYQKAAKKWLGVSPAILKKYGSISKETAAALAWNIRKKLKSDFGLAITGVAGPSKDENKKPGLVYLALSSAGSTEVSEHCFYGERQQVQEKAAKKMLEILWKKIR